MHSLPSEERRCLFIVRNSVNVWDECSVFVVWIESRYDGRIGERGFPSIAALAPDGISVLRARVFCSRADAQNDLLHPHAALPGFSSVSMCHTT